MGKSEQLYETHFESALTDKEHAVLAVQRTVEAGTFTLERALQIYGVTEEEYDQLKDIEADTDLRPVKS